MKTPLALVIPLMALLSFTGCKTSQCCNSSGAKNGATVAHISIDCEADWFSARIDLKKCKARFVLTDETWVHVPQGDLENFYISPTTIRFHRKQNATGLSNLVGLGVESSQQKIFLITDHGASGRVVVRSAFDKFDAEEGPKTHGLVLRDR